MGPYILRGWCYIWDHISYHIWHHKSHQIYYRIWWRICKDSDTPSTTNLIQFDQIWPNLTKYYHFSKKLVQKSHLLTKYYLWGTRTRKKKKRNAPARNAAQRTPDLGQKDKIGLFQKSRDFDLTYGANWSHIQLDITWLSHLIKMTQNLKNQFVP